MPPAHQYLRVVCCKQDIMPNVILLLISNAEKKKKAQKEEIGRVVYQ